MTSQVKEFKYFYLIAMLFVAMLLISNTIAVKIIQIGPFAIAAGIICFPISYIINDVLTEVYGYHKTRNTIWMGFLCLGLMSFFYYTATILHPSDFWPYQKEFSLIFGFIPRIAIGSFIAYLVGSFLNSYVMSIMKKWTKGRLLWTRTIGSTIVGEGADSIIFNTVAFAGIFELPSLLNIILTGFALKTLFEVVFTPITYWVVAFLKRKEGIDKFDYGISYNPFKLIVKDEN
jgi:queuosine precursor transporter